ncbi:hypothetical protein VPHD479_0352 [Vibrio phage D479]
MGNSHLISTSKLDVLTKRQKLMLTKCANFWHYMALETQKLKSLDTNQTADSAIRIECSELLLRQTMTIPHYDDLNKQITQRNHDVRQTLTDFYSKEMDKGFTSLKDGVEFPLEMDIQHHLEDTQNMGSQIISELLRQNGYKNVRINKTGNGLKITIHKNGVVMPRC